jgi:proline iminopeptidase
MRRRAVFLGAAAAVAAHPNRAEKVVFSSPGALTTGGLGGRPQQRLDWQARLHLYGLLAPPRALMTYALVQVSPAAAHAYAGDRELDARQDRVHAATADALQCPGQERRPLHGTGFYVSQVPQSLWHPAVPDLRRALAGNPLAALVLKGQCDYLDWNSAVELRIIHRVGATTFPRCG